MMLQSIKDIVLSIGKTLTEPIFVKEYRGMETILNELNEMKPKISNPEVLNELEMDMLYIKQGSVGEKNVYFELKNSFLPMYVLHNVNIHNGDYNAQLDFVIITNKFICVLETKKLNGDVTINNQGEFIRSLKNTNGKVYKKEGMYSPISQNQRHVRILSDLLIREKLIKHMPVLSLVVMANPKSIIDFKYTPKEIRQQIIKYDQLTPFLKQLLNKDSNVNAPIVTMQNIAEAILSQHTEGENTFLKKYEQYIQNEQKQPETKSSKDIKDSTIGRVQNTVEEIKKPLESNQPSQNRIVNIESIREKLIAFRKVRSKEEGVAAYYIFNNDQMECLIEKLPKTHSELIICKGFGQAKTEKYGDSIIKIINGDE